MTSSNLLNSSQLLEQAALDVYGLLDEYEAEQFTRSFHHAPASVQREVLRIQAELAADPMMMPDEEPGPELRKRVLKAVADAIEQRAARLAPLATIGRTHAVDRDPSRNRWSMLPPLMWRAATLALASVAVILLYFLIATQQHANQVVQWTLTNITSEQLRREVGPDFMAFFSDPRATRIVLQPAADAADAGDTDLWAVVLVNDTTGEAFLVCNGLPPTDSGEMYSISALTDDGETRHELRRFEGTGAIFAARIDVSSVPAASIASWEITGPQGNRLLFA